MHSLVWARRATHLIGDLGWLSAYSRCRHPTVIRSLEASARAHMTVTVCSQGRLGLVACHLHE